MANNRKTRNKRGVNPRGFKVQYITDKNPLKKRIMADGREVFHVNPNFGKTKRIIHLI